MRDQPTPEQTPERIAEIRQRLTEYDVANAALDALWRPWAAADYPPPMPDGYKEAVGQVQDADELFGENAAGMVRDLLVHLDALTDTLAHLTQERDGLRYELQRKREIIEAGQAANVEQRRHINELGRMKQQAEATLARIDAELRRHVSKDNANGIIGMIRDLAQVAVSQTGNVETLEATLARVKAQHELTAHLQRQREWSERTFGPGVRLGVIDHIRKELREIEADPNDLSEWIDVAILAFDGAWRAGHSPEAIVAGLLAKQAKNEARTWPDWRTMPTDKAIEHDRSRDAALVDPPVSSSTETKT